jgi:hypothetical protein
LPMPPKKRPEKAEGLNRRNSRNHSLTMDCILYLKIREAYYG